MDCPAPQLTISAVCPLQMRAMAAVVKRMKLMLPRVTPAPKVSAAHPEAAIPTIDEAIPPVAKLEKTRPRRGAGVNSCTVVQINGVNVAMLLPMMMMRDPATKGV